jgi:hypothetical protein
LLLKLKKHSTQSLAASRQGKAAAARAPVDQTHTEFLFEPAHLFAHGGALHACRACGCCEAAMFRSLDKGFEQVPVQRSSGAATRHRMPRLRIIGLRGFGTVLLQLPAMRFVREKPALPKDFSFVPILPNICVNAAEAMRDCFEVVKETK